MQTSVTSTSRLYCSRIAVIKRSRSIGFRRKLAHMNATTTITSSSAVPPINHFRTRDLILTLAVNHGLVLRRVQAHSLEGTLIFVVNPTWTS
jgi:hypothetical protein